ncbi:MAG TPA: hypothetical protein VKB81_04670 [Nitrospira sp.]|nr:hypothetical protein [Nitrospira sp.]
MNELTELARQLLARKPTAPHQERTDPANSPSHVSGLPSEKAMEGSLEPGDRITWQGADGKPRGPAIVEFIHTDIEGRVWAFYSLPDGGSGAVNTKYPSRRERND